SQPCAQHGTIPIVFVVVSDPVGDGLVTSIAHPGGNVTGFTNGLEESIGGKWIEILREIAPSVTRFGVMYNPRTAPGGGDYQRSTCRSRCKRSFPLPARAGSPQPVQRPSVAAAPSSP